MRRPIVRLSSLQLTNIKNVKKGTIYMPNTVNKILSADKAEILGIYGQNGSGKTAIVDACLLYTSILPPPPRKPKGKPTVENHVRFLEMHLVEELKKDTYTSLEAG